MAQQRQHFAFYRLGGSVHSGFRGACSIRIESDDCRRVLAGVVTTTLGRGGLEVFCFGDAARKLAPLRLAGLDGGKGTLAGSIALARKLAPLRLADLEGGKGTLAGSIALVWGTAADAVAGTAGLDPTKFGSRR